MRILHVGKFFPPYHGGIENFLADLMLEQKAQGIACAALAHNHDWGGSLREEVWEGMPLYRSPAYGKLVFVPISPLFAHHLKYAVRQFKPDVLHLHLPNASAFWPLCLSLCGNIPWVIHWHADVVASSHHAGLAAAYRFYAPLEQRLLKRAARIVATSPPYLESSAPLSNWRDKVRVVPLGLRPLSRQRNGEEAARWPEGEGLRVLCVGRLTYYKGLEILVRAAACTPGVHVQLVGKGDLGPDLAKLADRLGSDVRIRLSGALPEAELRVLMDTCDCLCLPSIERTEAFGLVLLEAMRAGKPCIVTDVPGSGMSWVVRAGQTGIVVKAGEVEGLARALAFARDNPERMAEMGRAGQERFESYFSIRAVSKGISEVYTEALNG